jgi:chemotaxis protein MotA
MATQSLRTARLSGLLGYVIGIASIFGAYALEGGSPLALLVLPALLIILGGTLSAALTGSSIHHILALPRLFRYSLSLPTYNYRYITEEVVECAITYRRDGFLALESRLPQIRYVFLQRMIRYVIDGFKPETIRDLAEAEIDTYMIQRTEAIQLFRKMGGYSPTMGIIGTVMGLISTLAGAGQDPAELIRHIATAFVATLWGILLANIVWLPIADKLQLSLDRDLRAMQVMADGVLALQAGEPPMMLRARLDSAHE